MTTSRREEQSAKDAIRTANEYAQFTVALVAEVRRRWPEMTEWIRRGARDQRVFNREDLRRAESIYGPEIKRVNLMVTTAEAVRQWQQHRVVYRLHPELARGLIDTDPSTPIPCEVFRRLPHPDPFVVFPSPIESEITYKGLPVVPGSGRLLGAMVTGLTDAGDLCSTTDSRLAHLNVAVAGSVQYVDHDVTFEEYSVRIPVSGRMSVNQMAAATNHAAGLPVLADSLRAHRLAACIMLYLCSDQRDIRTGESGRRRRPGTPSARAESTVVDVGFDVGPRLFAARRAIEQNSPSTGPGDRRVRPHIRRAHWHTYNLGSRDDPTPTVRWLNPILVNSTDRDPSRLTVIDATDQGQ